jgi:hypothetical protein
MGTEGKEDPRSVEELIEALNDESDDVRGDAASALTDFQDERAIEPLLKALKDPYPMVRECAAFALGEYKRKEHVDPLIVVLKDEVAEPRWGAAWALGTIGDPRAVEPLIKMLFDTDKSVRQAAARSLGEIGDPRAVKPLISALEDKDEYVRESAAESLGKLSDRKAVDGLTYRLKDESELVRNASAKSLGKLDPLKVHNEVFKALNFRIDDSVAKKEIKNTIPFAIGAGFLFTLYLLFVRMTFISEILSMLSLEPSTPFWIGLIITISILWLICSIIFLIIFFLLMTYWTIFCFAIVSDDGFLYNSDDIFEIIRNKINKRHEILMSKMEGVRFLVTSAKGKTQRVAIYENPFPRKKGYIIYVINGKKIDNDERGFIIEAIKESVLEYLIKPNED